MESNQLLWVCLAAFLADAVILAGLSLVMRLVMAIFPQKTQQSDSAIIAAIATVLQTILPGTKITKVEEIK